MPGISPLISTFTYRPPISGVTVETHSLVCGSEPGINIVVFPFHTPAPSARNLCSLPGVAARMQACISSIVQPGGNLISAGNPAGACDSFEASAIANEPTAANPTATTTTANTTRSFITTSKKTKAPLLAQLPNFQKYPRELLSNDDARVGTESRMDNDR